MDFLKKSAIYHTIMTDFLKARENMVESQIHTMGVVDEAILNSFRNIPRELFVPEKSRAIAYGDKDISIARGRYVLAPATLARMLQAAQADISDKVLDIGCGSGYSSAILSGITQSVYALDSSKRLLDQSVRLWERLSLINIIPIEGDFIIGAQAYAPFSLIIINAAVSKIPADLISQLAPSGRLVAILKSHHDDVAHAVLVKKSIDGTFYSSKELFDTNAPYLEGHEPASVFAF